jgi:hypothetical protein
MLSVPLMISSCSDDNLTNSPLDTQEEVLEQRSTGCAIDLEDLDCGTINTLLLTDFEHPHYPGCEFQISVPFVNCPFGAAFSGNYVGDYQITSHNCPQYVLDLQAAAASGDAALISFVQAFSLPVMGEISFQVALLDGQNSLICGDESFVVTWVKSQCTAVCVTEYGDGITSHRTFNCANTGCCYTTTEICINEENEVETTITRVPTQLPANCGGGSPLVPAGPFGVVGNPTLPGDGIPNNCTYITKCEFTCID